MKAALGLFLFLGFVIVVHCQASGKPGPQVDKENSTGGGWIDLFPGKNLEGWKRIPLFPDTKLSDRNPWKVDVKKKILICDGVDIKEMLLHHHPFGDGVYHVEWRFKEVPGKDPKYNSGVYVRSAADGKQWLQAQVAMLPEPPQVGDLFGDLIEEGKKEPRRVLDHGNGTKVVRPVGEWNTYDIHCRGTTITASLNGKEVSQLKNWPLKTGHVGLQAEFFYLEFKNMKFKKSK